MNTVKFLSHLRSLNVKIWLDGERLRVKAPPGVLTKELKDQMKEHKENILNLLQKAQPSAIKICLDGERVHVKASPGVLTKKLNDQLNAHKEGFFKTFNGDQSLEIKIWLDGERLRVKPPSGVALPKELKELLGTQKEDILKILKGKQPSGETGAEPEFLGTAPGYEQRRAWVCERLFPGHPVNSITRALEIRGPLDVAILRKSVEEIACRHDVFGGTLTEAKGVPGFQIKSGAMLPFSIVLLEDAENTRAEIDRFYDLEAGKGFSLEQSPLARCTLLKADEQHAVLVMSIHRLIADETSVSIFFGELWKQYGELTGGEPAQFPDKKSYSDYTRAQQEWLKSDEFGKHLSFWRKSFSDIPPTLYLPGDFPRPKERNSDGAAHRCLLDPSLHEKVGSFSSEVGEHLDAIFLAALATLLYRYSSQEKMMIANRFRKTAADHKHTMGALTDIRLFNLDLTSEAGNGSPTFKELVTQVGNCFHGAEQNHSIPLERLIEELQPDRDSSYSPICQIVFERGQSLSPDSLGDLDISPLPDLHKGIEHDFKFAFESRDQETALTFGYNRRLFLGETISRYAEHYQNLLGVLIEHADRPISEAAFLPDHERKMVLVEWNNNAVSYPDSKLVHKLFEAQVEKTPEATAIVGEDQQLSYDALNKNANRIAAYLRSKKVDPDTYVGILIDQSPHLIEAVLGILKAGCAVLLLDPADPKGRIEFMAEEADIKTLLTQKKMADKCSFSTIDILYLDEHANTLTQQSDSNPNNLNVPEHAASLTYTSGTSGKPNGVINTHAGISNLLLWISKNYELGGNDRILHHTSISMEGSLWTLLWPLMTGAGMVIARQDSSASLASLIQSYKVNVLHSIPPLLKLFLEEDGATSCDTLQRFICSGEAIPASIEKRFFESFEKAELHNLYGPSEAAVDVIFWACQSSGDRQYVPIGRPIANIQVFILDRFMQPVPVGIPGELYIAGIGLARGYLKRPELTETKFRPNPFCDQKGTIYKTGDLARYLADGTIEYLGRLDRQILVNGHRIELGEIETHIAAHKGVKDVRVFNRTVVSENLLVAYFTQDDDKVEIPLLQSELKNILPEYMIPSAFVPIGGFPLTAQGRIDQSALPLPKGSEAGQAQNPRRSYSEVERAIAQVWRNVLGIEHVEPNDNFFDIGGTSFSMIQVYDQLPELLRQDLRLLDLYNYPTIHALDLYLEHQEEMPRHDADKEHQQKVQEESIKSGGLNIAVIGMSCRTARANNPSEFWDNLSNGVDATTFFTEEELREEGVDPDDLEDPDYVRAKAVLDDVKGFDALFFEMTPREAQITDPQHRLFLECAWEALESGGYVPGKFPGKIGVFGGSGANDYLMNHINTNERILNTVGELPIIIGNDRDNLCTRVSFKLNLRGPSFGVQCACSTGLVSVHLACRSILAGECNMALAGGVSLRSLQRVGYLYEEGLLLPPDGRCRSFDAEAQGSVHGQGVGMVLLKKLEDAIQDGDNILAVVKGTAINNDGALKSNYSAYSQEGQTAVIKDALDSAGFHPESVSYIETSSTASPMGDPIEFNAMTEAYREHTRKNGFCGIGALKPSIGHTDVASSILAFIKATLALTNKSIPKTLHFQTPNPKMDLKNSPFYVMNEARAWPNGDSPRRAGVNAFGLGGTNAHVLLEEAPPPWHQRRASPWQLLTISARSASALEKATENLITFMKANPKTSLADLAYTLQVGRQDFKFRRMLVAQNLHEAIMELEKRDPRRVYTAQGESGTRPIAFLFPGQGAQYTNMGRQLYQVYQPYREEVDRCWQIIGNAFPEFYRGLSEKDRKGRTERVHQTKLTQFSLFVLEYALAKMLIRWGLKPDAMIGNSTGEYVAACLSGVFSLEDAITVVGRRGQLMQTLPPGDMLTVNLSEQEIKEWLNDQVSLAGVPSPGSCIVSGEEGAIRNLRERMTEKGIDCRIMFAPHAFHSYMVDAVVPQFAEMVREVQCNAPELPFISTITGAWITDNEATDPHYWARQQRRTVRFSQGIEVLLQKENRVLLEVGPDKTLSTPALQNTAKTRKHTVLATMRHPQEDQSDVHHLLTTLGRLWLSGVEVDWEQYHSGWNRYRIAIPTYPFEKEPHWIERPKKEARDIHLEDDEFEDVPVEEAEAHFRPNVSTGFVPPRDPIEQTIANSWKDLLGLGEVGIHDDFFELGGNSLIAVRLLNQLGKKLGVPLASHILLQKRTVAALADLVKENKSNPENTLSSTPMIEIQRGNPRVAGLYMVHPIGGEVYFYKDIALYMGPSQPVYGFQAPSLIEKNEPFTDLKEQAAFYLEELLRHKKPPFLLGGASYGGLVALEMAQQLNDKGIEVPLLVIVDSPAPGVMPSKFTDSASILEYLLGDKLELDLDKLRTLPPEDQMGYVFEQARISGRADLLPPTLGIPLFKTWMSHQQAMFGYEPKDYQGRVLFFRPTERMKVNPPNMHLPWIDLVKGGIEIRQIGGNHITMNFGANAKAMAQHLKRCLRSI